MVLYCEVCLMDQINEATLIEHQKVVHNVNQPSGLIQTTPPKSTSPDSKESLSDNLVAATSNEISPITINIPPAEIVTVKERCQTSEFDLAINPAKMEDRQTKFRCEHCAQSYTSKCAFRRHQKNVTCVKLEKKKQREEMQTSITIANKKVVDDNKQKVTEQHKCRFCTKQFLRLVHVENHERVHTGEKPFACNYCGQAYSQVSNRNTHELNYCATHEQRARNKQKFLNQKLKLTKHTKMDLRDSDCHLNKSAQHSMDPEQEETISSADSSVNHWARPIKCTNCERRFKNVNQMRKHKQYWHKSAATAGNKKTHSVSSTVSITASTATVVNSVVQAKENVPIQTIRTKKTCRFCGEAFLQVFKLLDHQRNCARSMDSTQK